MKFNVPSCAITYLAAFLCGIAPAAAAAESSGLQCSLTAHSHQGSAVAITSAFKQDAVIKLGNWRGKQADIRIHRHMLYPVFLQSNEPVAHSTTTKGTYLRFKGNKITAENDTIVANFKSNAIQQAMRENTSAQQQVHEFSGFRVLVGRHTQHDDNNNIIEANIYVRVVIDWSPQAQHTGELSLHRAAFIISQIPLNMTDQASREMYFRFPPNHSPFRMLACTLNMGQAT